MSLRRWSLARRVAMGGFVNAIWFWLPVLIYKAVAAFLRTAWKFNLWILQTISGMPLYYCRPEYRVPGIFLGTFGVIAAFNVIFFLLALGSISGNGLHQRGSPIGEFLIIALVGVSLLLLSRFLIRRGSI